MGVRPISRLTVNYFRITFRISLLLMLLIPIPGQTRDLEDLIVFVSRTHGTLKSDLFLVKGLKGRQIQLTQNLYASWPSISPDGTEVVFISEPPWGKDDILKLNIAKRPHQIENLTKNARLQTAYSDLDWSPDGQKILFIMTKATRNPKGESTSLCVMDMKTRRISHILQPNLPARIFNPSWSPDSKHILFLQNEEATYYPTLFVTDDNGNSVVEIRREDLENLRGWSPKRVVMLPAWSPSRSQMAYLGLIETFRPPPNLLQIYSMNLADGSIKALTSGSAHNRFPLAWRPDGRKILYATRSPFDHKTESGDIYVMDFGGENMINLTQTPERETTASWSPDGEHIVFERELSEEEISIFVMDANGQNSQRLTFGPGLNVTPFWSPGGEKIAFLSDRDGAARIYTMDRDGNNVQQITHRRRKFDAFPSWSPNGKWLAFGSGDEGNWGLFLFDLEMQNEIPIFRSNVSRLDARTWFRPAWSPDSQNLVFIAPWKEGEVGLMKIRVDGKMPTSLRTDGLTDWWSPVWSPDGNSLLFGAREKRESNAIEADTGLFLMNLEGEQLYSLGLWDFSEKRFYNRLTWGPDGSQLILSISIYEPVPDLNGVRVVEDLLYLIDIAGGTVTKWMDDAAEADWVRPGFVYAVNPSGKRISTWAELKKR